MDPSSKVGKQALAAASADVEQLVQQQNAYMDTRAAELLDHDPELIELYQRDKQWKIQAKELQGQLILLLESDQFALDLQKSLGTYKKLAERISTVLPDAFIHDGMALECAEAIEVLRQTAEEIRRQLAALATLSIQDHHQRDKVQAASFKAMIESLKIYRSTEARRSQRGFKPRRERRLSKKRPST